MSACPVLNSRELISFDLKKLAGLATAERQENDIIPAVLKLVGGRMAAGAAPG